MAKLGLNWKRAVRSVLLRMGLTIYRNSTEVGYTKYLPYNYATYSPWFEPWFQDIFAQLKGHTLVSEDRCYIVYKFGLHCKNVEGDFAECGVYKGGTAFLIAKLLGIGNKPEKTLHLFDTFTGLGETANDSSNHKVGDFGDASLGSVAAYLADFRSVVINPGLIPESFSPLRDSAFAFVHIDPALGQTVKDCCQFFYQRVTKGGVMLFDDYGFPRYKQSVKKAVDEFFAGKPEKPIILPTGQAVVLKL